MTNIEQMILRVAGLLTHAAGLVVVVVGILGGSGADVTVGVILFLVGGAWGWGMVVAVARREEQERADARSDAMARERMGQAAPTFTARFDDLAEPPPIPRAPHAPRADVPD